MKLPVRLLSCVAATFPIFLSVNAESSGGGLLDVVTALPPCALTCLVQAVANSTCHPTDQACICSDKDLNSATTACVLKSCTLKQGLTTLNVTSVACNVPIRDKRETFNTLSTTLGSMSMGFVALRLFERWLSDASYGPDDWAVTITSLVGLPSSILNTQGLTANGLGKDIYTLNFKMITDFIHVFFASELLYFVHVGSVKLTFLLLYLRIFPGAKIRKVIWWTLIVNCTYTFVFVLMGFFQCRPIRYFWKRWDGEHEGSCINPNAIGWLNASISILLDIWMLGIPITQIIDLNMHWKKRLGVGLMFSVGIFSTIVSIIRLRSLIVFSNTQNPTWDYYNLCYWSTIEINTGIMCACLPNLRVLLIRLFPTVMGTIKSISNTRTSEYATELNGAPESANKHKHSRTGTNTSAEAWYGSGIHQAKANDVEFGPSDQDRRESRIELVYIPPKQDM